jgi:hypothetical protein
MRVFVAIVLLLCAARASAQPPDVVMLNQLANTYEPVPFDHKSHARMAEMWDGCVTCHHRTPSDAAIAATQPASVRNGDRTQANAAHFPACKSCHEISREDVVMHMPNLKGAYHRQCLNCHRDGAHENACSACHKERSQVATTKPVAPNVDDIVGRMHPPIAEPQVAVYNARFTPAVGRKVLFRHKEHTTQYGLKCSNCHHRDNCSNCHDANATTIASKPIQAGRTWKDSHQPCMSCHKQDSCRHCHYEPGAQPPAIFEHRSTGQLLDADHVKLQCTVCHTKLKSKEGLTCGDAACHKRDGIAFPTDRPGTTVTTRPAAQLVAAHTPPTSQPATRPFIRRIRRGGS